MAGGESPAGDYASGPVEMEILIDESGQFIPLAGRRSRAAAVLALVVPSADRTRLSRDFRALKRKLRPGASEVKGSSITESEAAELFRLLHGYDVIVDAIVIDAGAHDPSEITRFKLLQAENLVSGITREHKAALVHDVVNLQQGIRQLADQLFVQVFCIWELIPRLLETATMYYAQRRPAELARFTWRVDAKDSKTTPVEEIWSSLVLPLLYSKSLDSPLAKFEEGDYTHFRRFDAEPRPPDVREEGKSYTDLQKLFREDFAFVRSDRYLGLQIADMIASILTRALNGAIGEEGWQGLGSLLIRRAERTVRVVTLSTARPTPPPRRLEDPRWVQVIQGLEAHAKPMITARRSQRATGGPTP